MAAVLEPMAKVANPKFRKALQFAVARRLMALVDRQEAKKTGRA